MDSNQGFGSLRIPLVGLRNEQKKIQDILHDQPQSYIVYITGKGGIGKTHFLSHVLNQYAETSSMCVARDIIDLYHTPTHTIEGLIAAIVSVLTSGEEKTDFAQYKEERNKLDRARSHSGGTSIQELHHQYNATIQAFIDNLQNLASRQRIVLALDTAERLFYQEDLLAKRLNIEQQRFIITDWLSRSLLPIVPNMVLLLAGRPGPESFANSLQAIPNVRYEPIQLHGLTEDESLEYFQAFIHAVDAGAGELEHLIKPADISLLRGLSEEERHVLFHSLRDSERMRVRPIRLALAIDHFSMPGDILPEFSASLEEARTLSATDRGKIFDSLAKSLIKQLHEQDQLANSIVLNLGRLRKGADINLLTTLLTSVVKEITVSDIEWTVERVVKKLSFIKIRPEDNRIFLHDEMYDLLEPSLTNTQPEEEKAFELLHQHYDNQIKSIKKATAEIYQSFSDPSALDLQRITDQQTQLQNAYVESLHYHLRDNAADGFEVYFCLAEEAMAVNNEALDFQLRAELMNFLAAHDQKSEKIGGLSRAQVEADMAIRWIKRLNYNAQNQEALQVVKLLKGPANQAIVHDGDKLTEIELKSWEALVRAQLGDLAQARSLLEETLQQPLSTNKSTRAKAILARVYNNLGYVLRTEGRFHGAISAYQQAIPLWRAAKIEVEQANTLNNRAFALAEVGKFDVAEELAWDALRLREYVGPLAPVSLSLNTLAHIKIRENAIEEAIRFAERAYSLAQKLDNKWAEGLTLIALAEAKRRFSDWEPHQPLQTSTLLEEAVNYAYQAAQIFTAATAPVRRVEALIEMGCAYRDWVKLKVKFATIVPKEQHELFQEAESALQEAANLAEKSDIPHRQIDALVNLGWLWYYTHTEVMDSEVVWTELERKFLLPIYDIIPENYRLTSTGSALYDIVQDDVPIIVPFVVQLAKLEMLHGQIAFNQFTQSGNQVTEALQRAVTHYTLSLEYNVIASGEGNKSRDMRRAMIRMYERLKALNVAELGFAYEVATRVQQQFNLKNRQMMQFLEDRFGPRELLAEL